MIVEINAPDHRPRRIRRSRWSFQKADWLAFRAECEAAFEEEPLQTAQEMSARFTACSTERVSATSRVVPEQTPSPGRWIQS